MFQKEVERAFKYCESIVYHHYENFPVASFLLSQKKRFYIFSIYAYARFADDIADDDIADEGTTSQSLDIEQRDKRLSQLDDVESKLDRLHDDEFFKQSSDLLFLALHQTVKDCKIPLDLLRDLLKAYRWDVCENRYATFEDLLKYCHYSANPIGRILLHIFGYYDPNFHCLSDKICTGLQLANFWQDISLDIKKDRLYISQDLLDEFHVHSGEIFAQQHSSRFSMLLCECIDRTEKIFYDGLPLCHILDLNLRYEIRWTWLRGIKILHKTRDFSSEILIHRPIISQMDVVLLLFKSFFSIILFDPLNCDLILIY